MKESDKPISVQIRNYYRTDGNIWIVEKGKVKEGKMLKAAFDAITRQNEIIHDLNYAAQEVRWGTRDEKDALTAPLRDEIYALKIKLEATQENLERILNVVSSVKMGMDE